MLLRMAVLDRIWSADVDLVFRRWRKPTVEAGGQLRTEAGMLEIMSIVRARHPRVRAQDPAESIGLDTATFKNDVRKLEAIGPPISTSPGYELSARGRS